MTGRPPITADVIARIRFLYFQTNMKESDVARVCDVTRATVNKYIRTTIISSPRETLQQFSAEAR